MKSIVVSKEGGDSEVENFSYLFMQLCSVTHPNVNLGDVIKLGGVVVSFVITSPRCKPRVRLNPRTAIL